MRIGIDASNIRGSGGGVNLLADLLRTVLPQEYGFEQIIVWGSLSTLALLENHPWLKKAHQPLLDHSLLSILYWQRIKLDHLIHRESCDVLYIPGGSYGGAFHPFVAMSSNMLPFEWSEARRYGVSWWTIKFILLRISQLATFKKADGVIFGSNYARRTVERLLGQSTTKVAVIYHGIDDRFRKAPKLQRPLSFYSHSSPFRLLYVSPIAPYKHQWHVMDAVWQLRKGGLPVTLDLVGTIRNCEKRFFQAQARFDPRQEWLRYRGEISIDELHEAYRQADAFVFASSCETVSLIMLEAMSAGLPIASSNRGPMPEVLGEAGVYFDPEKPAEIAQAVQTLMENPSLRQQKASAAYERAKMFTGERCARETFGFIKRVSSCEL